MLLTKEQGKAGKKILVLEDHAAFRLNLEMVLERAGYATITADNGYEGAVFAGKYLPDLILCDVNSEGHHRYAILEQLREQPETVSIPVILMTEMADQAGMRRAMELGADDYLAKPFSPDSLLAAVEARIKKQRALQSKAEQGRDLLEIQLRQAQKLEAIGQLAAGIAHEINTPTQFIGDNTRFVRDAFADLEKLLEQHGELLRAARENKITPELVAAMEAAVQAADLDYLLDEIPKAIEQSLEGVDRVTKIVRAMKGFSHPGTGEKVAVDLNQAIESTITVCRNEWKYVANTITDFDPNLPPVPCLPGEINQVILNIIVNAAHAIADVVGDGAHGKGTISISTRREIDWVEMRIRDTGTGIPESARGNIFEPFFTTKGVGKGTGQGLAIARSVVVDRHGGSITFETGSSEGTTFIIRLPLPPSS